MNAFHNSNGDSQTPFDAAQIARERAAYLYFRALEHGDFLTMARVLEEAESDPQLEAMLWAGHEEEIAATDALEREETLAQVHGALHEAFPGRVLTSPVTVQETAPKLTVADVAARLQLNESATGKVISTPDDKSVLSHLSQMQNESLPPRLTPRAISDFFLRLGVQASQRFREQFAEAAIFLRMGRQQNAPLSATRRAPAPAPLMARARALRSVDEDEDESPVRTLEEPPQEQTIEEKPPEEEPE